MNAKRQVPAREHWQANAGDWVRWARSEERDAYWYWILQFLSETARLSRGLTLDLGCGEGRVSRDLLRKGHSVIGLDLIYELAAAAVDLSTEAIVVVGDAESLPFPGNTFGTVVAYNSLMDLDHLEQALVEAARVLRSDGVLCASVVHPLFDAVEFFEHEDGTTSAAVSEYSHVRPFAARYQSRTRSMEFRGWSYSFEYYSRALEAAGFVIEQIREPMPARTPGRLVSGQRFDLLPPFLFLRCRKK